MGGTDLTALKGIGVKTAEAFEKLGVCSQEDLLTFFPRDYEVFQPPVSIGEIGYKPFVSVRGAFAQGVFQRKVKKMTITSARFQDETGASIKVTWFNAPFMKDAVHPGDLYILRGRVSRKYGVLQLNQPKVYKPEDYSKQMNRMLPIYPLTKGITQNLIQNAVRQAMEGEAFYDMDKEDPIPGELRVQLGLCKKSYAIRNLHFPETKEAYSAAVIRTAFEEIFLFILAMKRSGSGTRVENGICIRPDERTGAFLEKLPFALTEAQKQVIREIEADMEEGLAMNRLVQGDVGSGKTIVATAALMNAAFAGYQGAFMAPTEVLATQHFEKLNALFQTAGLDLKVGLLTGSMTAMQKRLVCDALENGRIDIIVGTHALFQEKVNYKKLGLVVTDEQHRFGIKQREALAKKAGAEGEEVIPHTMVMSATPIPRTLALILYGNMDVSVIDELPKGRTPIKNAVVNDSYKPQAYRFLTKEVRNGHQVYVICPLVEFSEGMDAQNVTDYSEMLREVLPEDITVGMLHGQMPPAKKNEIMARFAKGEIQVLVSTTVIEVGVDVPNATVMMVEDANRFGLAALHQLRGRVGRGADQSYCIFVCNNSSKEAMERLKILETSNNGFEIASKDLAMRGPGEFLGVRQSGALSFQCFDLYRDADIAQKAADAANAYLSGSMRLTKSEEERLLSATQVAAGSVLL